MWYFEDYYQEPAPKKWEKEFVVAARKQFDDTMAEIKLPLDDYIKLGIEHAENRVELHKGRFTLFLNAYNQLTKETEEEKTVRLTANYLRHQVLDYDGQISYARAEYYLSSEFFIGLWKAAMEAITHHFPELQSALVRGYDAKEAYDDYKFYGHSRKYPKLNDKAIREANADYFQMLDEREEQWRQDFLKAQEKEKQWKKHQITVSKQLVLLDGISELIVREKGRYYYGKIEKINKKTIKMTYYLKNGKKKTENIDKIYLYTANKNAFKHDEEADNIIKKNKWSLPEKIIETRMFWE